MVEALTWQHSPASLDRCWELVRSSYLCERICWSHFDPEIHDGDSVEAAVESLLQDLGHPCVCYFGVSFDMMWRMHWIRTGIYPEEGSSRWAASDGNARGEPDARASRYPDKWSCVSPVAFGPKDSMLAMEKALIHHYSGAVAHGSTKCTNSAKAGGCGTSVPELFLYVCHNDSIKCKCCHCKAGRVMLYGEGNADSSDEEEVVHHWLEKPVFDAMGQDKFATPVVTTVVDCVPYDGDHGSGSGDGARDQPSRPKRRCLAAQQSTATTDIDSDSQSGDNASTTNQCEIK